MLGVVIIYIFIRGLSDERINSITRSNYSITPELSHPELSKSKI